MLGHVVISGKDTAKLVDFYAGLFDMHVTHQMPGMGVFLSSRPEEEHHELGIFSHSDLEHIAFKLNTLEDLKDFYRKLRERSIPVGMIADHGVSISLHFFDPEEHHVEAYCQTRQFESEGLTESRTKKLSETDFLNMGW